MKARERGLGTGQPAAAEPQPHKQFLASYRRHMAFPGIAMQTKCMSTRILLGMSFTLPKNFFVNISVEPVNPPKVRPWQDTTGHHSQHGMIRVRARF